MDYYRLIWWAVFITFVALEASGETIAGLRFAILLFIISLFRMLYLMSL